MSEFGFGNGARTVQVTVPAEAFGDLDAMQKIQRDVLGQLGCGACCSGWDIRFDIARQFAVDEKLTVRALGPAVR